MKCLYANKSDPAEREKLSMWEREQMTKAISSSSQEELGCGAHVPAAWGRSMSGSLVVTGGKPYLDKDAGM